MATMTTRTASTLPTIVVHHHHHHHAISSSNICICLILLIQLLHHFDDASSVTAFLLPVLSPRAQQQQTLRTEILDSSSSSSSSSSSLLVSTTRIKLCILSSSSSSSYPHSQSQSQSMSMSMSDQAVTIIGAGPAGLATAIMMAQRGMGDIHVYEQLPAPAASDDSAVWDGDDLAKFYLIGLGGRGQKALQDLDLDDTDTDTAGRTRSSTVWEKVENNTVTVLGRKDWAPGAGIDEGVERIFGDDRPYKTKVLARDRLTGVLREVVLESYNTAITLHYDTEMIGVRWEDTANDNNNSSGGSSSSSSDQNITPVITLQQKRPTGNSSNEHPVWENNIPIIEDIRCKLLVGADGTARILASSMESYTEHHQEKQKRVRVVRYKDDNRRVYKTIPMRIPTNNNDNQADTGWRCDVNYSARTKEGRVVLDALPANTKGEYCAVLLLKADDEYAKPNSSAQGLRSLIDDTLPQFSPLISDDTLASVAKKPPSNIPRFTYVGGALHIGGSTVLLGDAIHTVKPYFGLGVNSALEDVMALRDALDQYDPVHNRNNNNNNSNDHSTAAEAALAAYSSARAEEAEALVRISRGLDRPGILGVFTFIVPIILDGIFQSIAPQWFELNTIALLQRDGIRFSEVGKIKRRDRILQMALLVLVLCTLNAVFAFLVEHVVPPAVVGGGGFMLSVVGGVSVLIFGISQLLRVFEPGMAPADVLAKTLQPVTDVISAENRGTVIANNDDNDDDNDDNNDDDDNDNGNNANPIPCIGKGGLPLL